jgi:hypothetical protein
VAISRAIKGTAGRRSPVLLGMALTPCCHTLEQKNSPRDRSDTGGYGLDMTVQLQVRFYLFHEVLFGHIAHNALHWLAIFERLYVCYRIAPFDGNRIRAVRKEKKLYFWDWSRAPDTGARLENMVAGHLLKYCHFLEDTEGYDMELRFIRDTDCREVDFVVLRDGTAEFAVECKTGERRPAPACSYFRERTDIPRFYQVHLGQRDFGNEASATRVLPFHTFCREVGMP